MRLLPDIKGLYRDDLMKMAERHILEPDIDAVLLTHAYSDHADYISFLHVGHYEQNEITIYEWDERKFLFYNNNHSFSLLLSKSIFFLYDSSDGGSSSAVGPCSL